MEESSRLYTKEIRVVEVVKARPLRSTGRDGRSLIISLGPSPLRD
jgi:hypothetical protein